MGNHNSGRRPKPTALKVLRGNPGKRKLNEAEPKPPQGVANPPENLSASALTVWAQIGPVATAMGTLSTADVYAFGTLCELIATQRMAAAEKDREGFSAFLITTVPDPDGETHIKITEHPAIKLERNTAAALRPYYEKFGLEPVGRARISVPKQEAPVSKWAGVLG